MSSSQKDVPPDHLIVYTCIAGGYDNLRPVPQAEAGVSYICFAEPGFCAPDPWIRRDLIYPPNGETGSRHLNRFHKLFPQRLFHKQRYSVYQDGNVCFRGSYLSVLEKFRGTRASIGAFRHFADRTLESEAQACRDCDKFNAYDLKVIEQQLQHYLMQGYPMHEKISANYFLVRDHSSPVLESIMDGVWQDLNRFTSRDQISLPFQVWSNEANLVFLDELGIPLEWVQRHYHKNEFFREILPGYIKRKFNRYSGLIHAAGS